MELISKECACRNNYWRASVASETLTGVKMKKIDVKTEFQQFLIKHTFSGYVFYCTKVI